MSITEKHLSILRHALGWPKLYRNHFVTGPGCDNYPLCEELVAAGLMTRTERDWIPDYIYTVTAAGREEACKGAPRGPDLFRAQRKVESPGKDEE